LAAKNFGKNGPYCRVGKKTLANWWAKNFSVLATQIPVIDEMEAWHDQNACSMSRNQCIS